MYNFVSSTYEWCEVVSGKEESGYEGTKLCILLHCLEEFNIKYNRLLH